MGSVGCVQTSNFDKIGLKKDRKNESKISRRRRSNIDGRRKSSGMVVVVAGEEVVVTPAETKVVVFSAAGKGPPHNFALFA